MGTLSSVSELVVAFTSLVVVTTFDADDVVEVFKFDDTGADEAVFETGVGVEVVTVAVT